MAVFCAPLRSSVRLIESKRSPSLAAYDLETWLRSRPRAIPV